MLGVLVNSVAVILGSALGMLFKKGIPERINKTIMVGLGICTAYIGITGSLEGKNVLILITAMVLGALTGALLKIDDGVNRLGKAVEKKFRREGQSVSLAEGWVSATLLFCIGSMAVTGSLQSGLTGNHTVLYTKSALDFVAAIMLASSLGIGVMLSSVSVFVVQGAIALLAEVLAPVLGPDAVAEMTCIGSLLIVMIGTNMMGITKIKVADYLPGVIYAPVICNLIPVVTGWFR